MIRALFGLNLDLNLVINAPEYTKVLQTSSGLSYYVDR
jgi:hypothetical protein